MFGGGGLIIRPSQVVWTHCLIKSGGNVYIVVLALRIFLTKRKVKPGFFNMKRIQPPPKKKKKTTLHSFRGHFTRHFVTLGDLRSDGKTKVPIYLVEGVM